ncbi:MAG: ABC transporter ATP-binding protein [Calditrichaeota bacterium]|nr:MAG: ABC transporter ATP-binding protein [Calditrichota bacterium]MBL1204988.1 ABC transporter ATP-binding protein [Calditrichota bacterium]NOG44818.1 ABC transporter ATP-binding protein [Calditrichota bacterium]
MSKKDTAVRKTRRNSIRYVFNEILLPRKKVLFIGLILIIINRLSGLVLPGASKYLLDSVILNSDYDLLYTLLVAVIAAVAVQSVTSFSLVRLLSVEAQHLISLLRAQVQKQILFLPVRFFDNSKSGSLVSRIMSDAEGVRNLVGTGLVQLFGGVLTSIIALIILLKINIMMTLIAIVPLLLFGLISMKAFAFIRPIFRERSVINADVTGRLTESLNGIRVIKGFNAEKQEMNVFEKGVEQLYLNVKKSLTSSSLVTSSATLLMGITSVAIMGVGGNLIINNEMTTGDFVAFILYLAFLIAPIVQMSNIGSQITEAFAGLDRMDEIFQMEKENQDNDRSVQVENIKGNIRFDDVHFSYDEGTEVLRNISFDAPSGTVTALVGSSGSGKTTIAGLAASYFKPGSGKITIDENDLSKVTLESYRSQLGVVLQDDFLFEGTIKENILFPRPDASNEQVNEAVKAAYVDEFTNRFDDGLDTLIGERGVKLSGGQRQRIAIARAILADPKILVLDEATSNLDTESEKYIQQSLEKLMKGRTTFVIAHRLSTIRQADQILVIEEGQIVERGTHDDLIKTEGRYHRLYTYQARI